MFLQHTKDLLTDEEIELQRDMRKRIELELNCQMMIARGHDRWRRPILYKGSRTKEQVHEKSFQAAYIYSVERCCAIAEILTTQDQQQDEDQHIDQRITTIVELGGSGTLRYLG